MYNTEVNKHRLCICDNFFNYRQPHQHIHLKGKKQVLQCTNSKILLVKKLRFIENLRIKSLSCFKHQVNITVFFLSCGCFFH